MSDPIAPKWVTKAGEELGYDEYDLMALFSVGGSPEERARIDEKARELQAAEKEGK